MSAVMALTACGQTLAPLPGSQALQAPSAIAGGAQAALLYVSHTETVGGHQDPGVAVFTYPQGKRAGNIDLPGYPGGVCSDASGNVWVTDERSQGVPYAEEFPHGQRHPVLRLRLPHGTFQASCAVDRTSGDLAVTSQTSTYAGKVLVWAGAHKGIPAVYRVPFAPTGAAYDDAGNLFIDGVPGGSDFWLLLGELAKGEKKVNRISLDVRGDSAGGLQWDGAYLAVATSTRAGGRIFRISVSGHSGHVADQVRLTHLNRHARFDIIDGVVVAQANSGRRIGIWAYPSGNERPQIIAFENFINGLTISK
ncbi:MAG TPA: hypothetical protein VEW74_02755 [Candidatus Nitrosotalea sp.]|nr:hypothetical protein [Candidatus Nitrosotalea sp.]